MSFHVYILKCADGSYYTGHTEDVEGRLSAHELGLYANSYTSRRMPADLLWSADFPTRSEALEYEHRVKGWTRAKKEALIVGDWELLRLLSKPRRATAVRPEPVEGRAGSRSRGQKRQLASLVTRVGAPTAVRPEPVEGRAESRNQALELNADLLLQACLQNMGLQEYRRVVRESDTAIVISKFEPGFSQELFATVDRLPELFDEAIVAAEYDRIATSRRAAGESTLRTAVWRQASEAVLGRICAERGIDHHRRMFVLPGIESVQAVMDSILWTAPTIGDDYQPNRGELEAYAEFEAGLLARELPAEPAASPGRDIFTRYYGELDGRRVENYCPGAPFARRLVAQAWNVCTRPRVSSD